MMAHGISGLMRPLRSGLNVSKIRFIYLSGVTEQHHTPVKQWSRRGFSSTHKLQDTPGETRDTSTKNTDEQLKLPLQPVKREKLLTCALCGGQECSAASPLPRRVSCCTQALQSPAGGLWPQHLRSPLSIPISLCCPWLQLSCLGARLTGRAVGRRGCRELTPPALLGAWCGDLPG
ncbi:uncharacterized protein LOC141927673 isoform X2 [Strix aluco]|uniref:uncharacterized protein LOC141927673 isoform X2 n=1 Tax=Strix aluco TaxID=111821 RepID=UPI003DA27B1D